jgi:hypothetical protein
MPPARRRSGVPPSPTSRGRRPGSSADRLDDGAQLVWVRLVCFAAGCDYPPAMLGGVPTGERPIALAARGPLSDPARLERAATLTDCGLGASLPGRRALGGFRHERTTRGRPWQPDWQTRARTPGWGGGAPGTVRARAGRCPGRCSGGRCPVGETTKRRGCRGEAREIPRDRLEVGGHIGTLPAVARLVWSRLAKQCCEQPPRFSGAARRACRRGRGDRSGPTRAGVSRPPAGFVALWSHAAAESCPVPPPDPRTVGQKNETTGQRRFSVLHHVSQGSGVK